MMSTMFSEPDLETMQRVRCAFDPLQLSNPSKIFPRPRLCGEKPGEYVAHPLETAGIAEGFLMDARLSAKTKGRTFLTNVRRVLTPKHVRTAVASDAVAGAPPRPVCG